MDQQLSSYCESAASKFEDDFNFTLKQVKVLYSKVNLFEYGILKEVVDGRLMECDLRSEDEFDGDGLVTMLRGCWFYHKKDMPAQREDLGFNWVPILMQGKRAFDYHAWSMCLSKDGFCLSCSKHLPFTIGVCLSCAEHVPLEKVLFLIMRKACDSQKKAFGALRWSDTAKDFFNEK
ncbi:hypothetical protein E2542_SST13193 [Spatholobus suberectus]|nr:hypothetical protein E2542_SST13193 [Spatholobus suberectus]